jgi:poly(A) polymerase
VGRAWAHLKELRLDRGPLDRDEAEAELLRWWAGQNDPQQNDQLQNGDPA